MRREAFLCRHNRVSPYMTLSGTVAFLQHARGWYLRYRPPVRRAGQANAGEYQKALRIGVSATLLVSGGLLVSETRIDAQRRPLDPPIPSQSSTPQHRTRLYLRDGTYQTVLSYSVRGKIVQYRSAERNGQLEELPLTLVDLESSRAWERAHDPVSAETGVGQTGRVLSPELARDEAARAARTPEVAPDLRLPEGNSVLVLDTYRGTPELVPLPQNGSSLNRETAHAIVKREINPAASPHDLELVKEERADVQLHVADPIFFIRSEAGDDEVEATGEAFVVDTEGQGHSRPRTPSTLHSSYVLERLDVRQGARALSSLRIGALGTAKQQADVIELRQQALPGGIWQKLTPLQPLEFGEYAVVEVLNDRAVNALIWDFGVHPTAKENDEALRPEPKRPLQLERRRP